MANTIQGPRVKRKKPIRLMVTDGIEETGNDNFGGYLIYVKEVPRDESLPAISNQKLKLVGKLEPKISPCYTSVFDGIGHNSGLILATEHNPDYIYPFYYDEWLSNTDNYFYVGAYDKAGNVASGIIPQGETVPAQENHSIEFTDDTSQVIVSGLGNLPWTDSIINSGSISFWIKHKELGAPNWDRIIGKLKADHNPSPFRILFNTDNPPKIVVQGGGDNGSYSHPSLTSILPNVAYHIVWTWEDSCTLSSLYINGVLDSTSDIAAGEEMEDYGSPIYFGKDSYGGTPNQAPSGYLEDFRIYNRDLASGEINAMYSGYLSYTDNQNFYDDDLLLQYSLNEGYGSRIFEDYPDNEYSVASHSFTNISWASGIIGKTTVYDTFNSNTLFVGNYLDSSGIIKPSGLTNPMFAQSGIMIEYPGDPYAYKTTTDDTKKTLSGLAVISGQLPDTTLFKSDTYRAVTKDGLTTYGVLDPDYTDPALGVPSGLSYAGTLKNLSGLMIKYPGEDNAYTTIDNDTKITISSGANFDSDTLNLIEQRFSDPQSENYDGFTNPATDIYLTTTAIEGISGLRGYQDDSEYVWAISGGITEVSLRETKYDTNVSNWAKEDTLLISMWAYWRVSGPTGDQNLTVRLLDNTGAEVISGQLTPTGNDWHREFFIGDTLAKQDGPGYLEFTNDTSYTFFFTQIQVEKIDPGKTNPSPYKQGRMAGYIPTHMLEDSAVTGVKIADATISGNHFAPGAGSGLSAADIPNNFYGGGAGNNYLYRDGAPTSLYMSSHRNILLYGNGLIAHDGISITDSDGNIATDRVLTDSISGMQITTPKINDLAVTTAKINTNAVTLAKMADDSVDTDELVDYAVTGDKLNQPTKTHNLIAQRYAKPVIDEDYEFNDAVPTTPPVEFDGDKVWKIAASDSELMKEAMWEQSVFGCNQYPVETVYITSMWVYATANNTITYSVKNGGGQTCFGGTFTTVANTWTRVWDYDGHDPDYNFTEAGLFIDNSANAQDLYFTNIQIETSESDSVQKTEPSKFVNNGKATFSVNGQQIANYGVDTDQLATSAIETNKINDSAVTNSKIAYSGIMPEKFGFTTEPNLLPKKYSSHLGLDETSSKTTTYTIISGAAAAFGFSNENLVDAPYGMAFQSEWGPTVSGLDFVTATDYDADVTTFISPSFTNQWEVFTYYPFTSKLTNGDSYIWAGYFLRDISNITSVQVWLEWAGAFPPGFSPTDVASGILLADFELIGDGVLRRYEGSAVTLSNYNVSSPGWRLKYICSGIMAEDQIANTIVYMDGISFQNANNFDAPGPYQQGQFNMEEVIYDMKNERLRPVAWGVPGSPLYQKYDMVATENIQNSGVTTTKITDQAITTAKIADEGVTAGKISDETIKNNHVSTVYPIHWDRLQYIPRGEVIWCSVEIDNTNPADAGEWSHATNTTETYETPICFSTKLYPETSEVILNLQMNQTSSASASGIAQIEISGLNSIGYYSVETSWVLGVDTGAYTTLSGVIDVSGVDDTDLCWVKVSHKSSTDSRVNTIKNVVVEKNTWAS